MIPSDVDLHPLAEVCACALEVPSHALRVAIRLTVLIVMECSVMAERPPMTLELKWTT